MPDPRARSRIGPMSDLPAARFLNPVWHALKGPHRHLALEAGPASRYPADVAPFAALEEPSPPAFGALRALLEPRESVWIADEPAKTAGLMLETSLECLQMVLPGDAPLPDAAPGHAVPPGDIEALSAGHAREMVALTDLAFPGFFRLGTHRMGRYFGVRRGGVLAAMAGERLMLDGYREMSAICTHPGHRGQGLARALILHLAHRHRREGLVSWLHVGSANTGAIALYQDLGFATVRSILLHRVARAE
jgi:ribosomal protein S18 acetylase RimI-like enzyme